jgi:hypothetical protein
MSLPAEGPWRSSDVLRLARGIGIGAIGLASAWVAASITSTVDRQLYWVALGVVSVLVAAFSMVAWLLFGLRAVGLTRHQVAAELRTWDGRATEPPDVERGHADPGSPQLFIASGMTRYHKPDCLLIRGKESRPIDAGEIGASGLRPCGVCNP